jgi:group I intron endonuclease
MPNYEQGKIYRIDCLCGCEGFYIGCTTQPLKKRMNDHRNHHKYPTKNGLLYKHMKETDFGMFKMILIEEYPCEDKESLEKRESEWITNLKPTYNTAKPYVENNKRASYKDGKIYKVFCKCGCEKFYIGSTIHSLKRRMSGHRSQSRLGQKSPLQTHIREVGEDNFDIELVENYPCKNKQELNKKEAEIMKRLKPQLNGTGAVFSVEKDRERKKKYEDKMKAVRKIKKGGETETNVDKENINNVKTSAVKTQRVIKFLDDEPIDGEMICY